VNLSTRDTIFSETHFGYSTVHGWATKAARQLAAEERTSRIRAALERLPRIAENRKAKDREKARASTTDAYARVMKMGDGGFRPSFNVQLATATDSQIITGVDVTNSGGDQGQMAPMVEQHQERYEEKPTEMLVDGGFVKKADIDEVSPTSSSPSRDGTPPKRWKNAFDSQPLTTHHSPLTTHHLPLCLPDPKTSPA
jgi:hypothetical protein